MASIRNSQPPTRDSPPAHWRQNVVAVTAATFIGFTGFTLVMPFLPLYFRQLGVDDVGDIAFWSGLSLGVTPAVTAILSPFWGRLADRFGRKIMVERSLVSFVVVMASMAFVTEAWHVFALRAVQGLFAGYGALALAMAADSAPKDRMSSAIGIVQTAQRLGPALGPVIGGAVAQLVGLRRAFLVTAAFYVVALVVVFVLYHEPRTHAASAERRGGAVTFRNVLAFENFILLIVVIFAFQFVDRSFGPVLPLFIAELGTPLDRVPIVAGVLFSLTAASAALGNAACGWLMHRASARAVIA
ncbi:MAG TPA: MFS transporter, partial [Vicinamibacterales bacterium]|nr:MFS transporter [Vicinamibacterales bacterium]